MLIQLKDLKVGYGKKTVVHGVSLAVDKREIVALFGHNGAGKTTTLKGIIGLLQPSGGEIVYSDYPITGHSPTANVKDGITFIPQERVTFGALNVRENLELGAYTLRSRAEVESRLEIVHKLFPILKEREWQRSRTLSGGEQRMLSMGMGMMVHPRLLLLDEPSLGLAPLLVQRLMDNVQEIQKTMGTAVILVEQNVKQALRIAQRVYVMKMGRIILEESAEEFLKRGSWWDLF